MLSVVNEHRGSDTPGKDLGIAVNANGKFTVLCCTLSTALRLVSLTSHNISQNYSITSFFFSQHNRVIIM